MTLTMTLSSAATTKTKTKTKTCLHDFHSVLQYTSPARGDAREKKGEYAHASAAPYRGLAALTLLRRTPRCRSALAASAACLRRAPPMPPSPHRVPAPRAAHQVSLSIAGDVARRTTVAARTCSSCTSARRLRPRCEGWARASLAATGRPPVSPAQSQQMR